MYLKLRSVLNKASLLVDSELFGTINRNMNTRRIVFEEFGDPVKVTKLVDDKLPDSIAQEEVIVKMLLAPINPADINTIQGVYPIKPKLPSSPGNEGVGEVISVGSNVTNVVPGDRVVPLQTNGTWQSAIIVNSSNLIKVDKDIDLHTISGIKSNPSTAYRMLKDFVSLNEDDVVIQNGANSACGQNVIQLAHYFKYKNVNIIRSRPQPDLENLKNHLKSLGATYVFTEDELRVTSIFKDGTLPKPRLALNSVGGKSATEILRSLDDGGIMVTYGGMSREPVAIPTSLFIFKDIQLKGFWMTRWSKQNIGSAEQQQMYHELSQLMKNGYLVAPTNKTVPLGSFKQVLQNSVSTKGFTGVKYFLDLQK